MEEVAEKQFLEFKTEQEYLDARAKHDANHAAVMEYCKKNKTNSIPAEIAKTFPFENKVTNELRSAIEQWEFKNNPPQKYMVYVDKDKRFVITWTGQPLGVITSLGQPYRSNFGDQRRSIQFKGINGKRYFGTYFCENTDCANVKQMKEK